ncbi:MAG: hypothetical protein ACRC6B_08025 [Fusobacteriaceae bacterium]
MLPTSGAINFAMINDEIGVAWNSSCNIYSTSWLAGKGAGSRVSLSDYYGKRHEAGYHCVGWATTELQVNDRWDSGVVTKTYYNIPRGNSIRARIWAATNGSHNSGSPGGYAYVAIWIRNKNDWNSVFWSSSLIDRWTSGDGSGGIGNASWQWRIADLIGWGENVTVQISKRIITGGYTAHIWGGRNYINRICGAESDIGF